ncbi:hypothetical protein KR044_005282, partial [Drosophila immigrans]
MFTVSLVKIVLLIWTSYPHWLLLHSHHATPDDFSTSSFTADEWLAYQHLLHDKGKCREI